MATPIFRVDKVSDHMQTFDITTDTGARVTIDVTQRNGRLKVDIIGQLPKQVLRLTRSQFRSDDYATLEFEVR